MKFALVNVFTTSPNLGNQLAVVFLEKELSKETMQTIAANFNFSETVFILEMENEIPSLRIFTPKSELPFAGHPTIGAGWMLSQILGKKEFSVKVPAGVIAIKAHAEGATLTFPNKPVIRPYEGDLLNVLEHCGVEESEIAFNPYLVSVGPEFLVIPLKSKEALIKAKSPISLTEAVKCYFIHEENPSQFKVRMFAPSLSVIEDPATGSAACALAGYLAQVLNRSTGKVSISQGAELNRACEIQLEWDEKICVGGKVHLWAQGSL